MVRRPVSGPRRQSKYDIRGSKCLDICDHRTHRIFYYVMDHLQAVPGHQIFEENFVALIDLYTT